MSLMKLCCAAFSDGLACMTSPLRMRIHPYLSDVQDHVIRAVESIDSLLELVKSALEAHLLLTSAQQNNIIKIFSVAAVVLMPPTLVAAIYGMNFKGIPELDWQFGYPAALILMLVVAVLPYLFFKWKKWLWRWQLSSCRGLALEAYTLSAPNWNSIAGAPLSPIPDRPGP
jgi:Mg2+ and Co2+ transporter CorA